MILVVTDTGLIWNHLNPVVNQYKYALLVVCLNGKRVTDAYDCFVSPYKDIGAPVDRIGFEDPRFKALDSAGKYLNNILGDHEDVVFLTDVEPSTLYPFYVLKDRLEFNNAHLLVMPPFAFETNAERKVHFELLADLSKLDSFLYYDINEKLKTFDKGHTIDAFLDYVRSDLARLTPRVLNGIYHMEERPCYFDFSSETYVPLREGFKSIDITQKSKIVTQTDFPVEKCFATLGNIIEPFYPEEDQYVKDEIERPVARIDGKKVCNILREQRKLLAAANNIPFESAECPSIGPCSGTCEKCDMESSYLRDQLLKIPKHKRVYPQFDPIDEMKS